MRTGKICSRRDPVFPNAKYKHHGVACATPDTYEFRSSYGRDAWKRASDFEYVSYTYTRIYRRQGRRYRKIRKDAPLGCVARACTVKSTQPTKFVACPSVSIKHSRSYVREA